MPMLRKTVNNLEVILVVLVLTSALVAILILLKSEEIKKEHSKFIYQTLKNKLAENKQYTLRDVTQLYEMDCKNETKNKKTKKLSWKPPPLGVEFCMIGYPHPKDTDFIVVEMYNPTQVYVNGQRAVNKGRN